MSTFQVVDYDTTVGVFCGTDRPPLITSTGDKLQINFITQNAVTDFEAHFSVVGMRICSVLSSSYILSTAITYPCVIAAKHFMNGPHTDVYRSISKGLRYLNASTHRLYVV